jgi:hypothetical protein
MCCLHLGAMRLPLPESRRQRAFQDFPRLSPSLVRLQRCSSGESLTSGTTCENCRSGLGVGGEKADREIAGGAQTRGAARINKMALTTTAAVAMSPCVPPGIVRLILGTPGQFNRIGRSLRAHVHFQFQINQRFAARDAASDLVNAGNLAGLHLQEFRLHSLIDNGRLDGFGDVVSYHSPPYSWPRSLPISFSERDEHASPQKIT